MKSRIMLAAIHRGLHCLPKCLFYEKVQRVNRITLACCGRKLRHIPNTYHRVPNIATFLFYRRMAENGFAPHLGNFADISYLVEN